MQSRLFVFVIISLWVMFASAQQPADKCTQLNYAQYTQARHASRLYRLDRIEGQTVYAPITQKWDSASDGICVAVFNQSDGKLVAAIAAHDGGQFQFANLEPGKYTLVAAVDELQEIVVPVRLDKQSDKKEHLRLLLHLRLKGDRRKSFVTIVPRSSLRAELRQMVAEDQAIRNEWIKAGFDRPQPAITVRMAAIDARNLDRMKRIVRKYGWPGPEIVGVDGTEAAFLIVQHARHAFQKQMLPLVTKAFRAGKLQGPDYALLLDRVLVGEGKRQVFGTQAKFFNRSQAPELYPIADEVNVDKRRAAVGLGPLAEYVNGLKQMYFPKP